MKIIKIAESQLSDSWEDDIDYLEELGLTIDQLLTKHGANFQRVDINGNPLIIIYEENYTYVIDDPNDTYPTVKEAEDWINGMWDAELEMFIPTEDHDFWEYPETLYHATNSENVPSIKRYGLRPEDQSRGISNRSTGSAVFTSRSDEDIESYGDVIIAINTHQMKIDGYTPEVSEETPLEESNKKERLANMIGLDNYIKEDYSSEGLSDNTIIVYGLIPPKYLEFY